MPDAAEFARRFPHIASFLAPDQLESFIAALATRDLHVGETLVERGKRSDAVFFVQDGEIVVDAGVDKSLPDGQKKLGAGAILGEVSLLDPDVATATVTATARSNVLWLGRDALARLRTDNPRAATAVYRALCSTLAARIRTSTDRLDELRAGAPTGTRKAGLLDALRGLFGSGGAR